VQTLGRIYQFYIHYNLTSTSFLFIIESVLKNHTGTEDDMCQAIKKFFKYAPDRKGGSGRK
jgi:sulfur relay (sulfurtransferase) DsrC/TusE family protein